MAKMDFRCIASAALTKKLPEETNTEYYNRVKKTFLDNVFKNKYSFKKKPIKFATWKRKLPTEDNPNHFEIECFYHTISSIGIDGGIVRTIDIERYQKCLLLFTILDICSCDQIQCQIITIKPDRKYENRVNIYCNRFQYVIVLEEQADYFKYITSFPVSDNNVEKYL